MVTRKHPVLWLAAPAAQLAYFAAFPFLSGAFGSVVAVLPNVAIVGSAWLFGMRGAVAAAAFAVVANTQMYMAQGDDTIRATVAGALVAALSLGVAWAVDRLRDDKERIQRLRTYDALTQLPNRDVFHARLLELLGAGSPVRVAFVDVIGFREVNESFGHEVGDDVIREIAWRLRSNFANGLVARLGTDNFAVLDAAASDEDVAERVLGAFRSPFLAAGSFLTIDGRVGIARSPEHGESTTTLMSAAEAAARSARRLAAGWASASLKRSEDGSARLRMLSDLRQALERRELKLHYQPLLDVTSGKIVGFEALMRWQRNGEMVPPVQFIPLAEQTGLIVPLTDWVVDEAARQGAEWARAGHVVRISLNVGAKTIGASARLESVIAEAVERHGVSATQFTVEVTETDVMTDPVQASRTLAALKTLGVRVAMDDFGTGYSSLSYLNELPLDEVKIDRSFISRLLSDPQTSSIVRAAVDLSHALGLDATAEGVEDEATLERLTLLGCDRAQGYFIARPMPADAVLPWLQRYEPTPIVVRPPADAVVSKAAHDPNTATVLVIDDEHSLRVATHRILSGQGYNVLHAATASEALRIYREQGVDIDLIVTDIFLTDWRGNDLAARIREANPDLKVLFVSGDPKASELVQGAPFLAKPFSKQQLIDHVGIVLAA
jgi:diguanylate cyclase (GGDEF)-like protein